MDREIIGIIVALGFIGFIIISFGVFVVIGMKDANKKNKIDAMPDSEEKTKKIEEYNKSVEKKRRPLEKKNNEDDNFIKIIGCIIAVVACLAALYGIYLGLAWVVAHFLNQVSDFRK